MRSGLYSFSRSSAVRVISFLGLVRSRSASARAFASATALDSTSETEGAAGRTPGLKDPYFDGRTLTEVFYEDLAR
jgi:hypothetical protein